MKLEIKKYLLFIPVILFNNCVDNAQNSKVNPAHLNHLYQEINVNGTAMGITHIYADYPDYKWVGDDDEGEACIDDVARASIIYIRSGDLEKAKKQLEFVLYMQSENGWFYNFVWGDYSINKTHQNSIDIPNWWTWRALVSLINGYNTFIDSDKIFADRLLVSINKTINAMKEHFVYEKKIVDLNGFKRPSWLPYQYAADQASIIITALSDYYSIQKDEFALKVINDFAEGIILMQEGNENTFPYYAFMSWENQWHAWGNTQSYSLIKAYKITNNKKYLDAALNEINNFYPYLLKRGFLNEFSIKKNNGEIVLDEEKQFSQIAYGTHSMILGALEAAKVTGDKKYSELAAAISTWFFGNNPAKAQMYFPATGVGFDGISEENVVNKNSGAESTIEALLAIQAIEKDKIANETLLQLIKKYEDMNEH